MGAPHVSRQVVVEGKRGRALGTAEGFLIGVKLAPVSRQALLVAEIPGFQLRSVHCFAIKKPLSNFSQLSIAGHRHFGIQQLNTVPAHSSRYRH